MSWIYHYFASFMTEQMAITILSSSYADIIRSSRHRNPVTRRAPAITHQSVSKLRAVAQSDSLIGGQQGSLESLLPALKQVPKDYTCPNIYQSHMLMPYAYMHMHIRTRI